jgi:hypothetical protein
MLQYASHWIYQCIDLNFLTGGALDKVKFYYKAGERIEIR